MMDDDAPATNSGDAAAFLAERGVPATAREFRLRQEFFRHRWDVRVRDEKGVWTVRAVKPDRPDALGAAPTEGDALRLALAAALRADESDSTT